MNKTKIAFFGASVTQQKTGYVHYFSKKTECSIFQFGYGSMHIHDAGICFIDKVIEHGPSYCFLDWFSPGIEKYNKQNLLVQTLTLVKKLYQNNCIPVLLFFPINDPNNSMEKRIEIYDFIIQNVCVLYDVPYIEVYKHLNTTNFSLFLRDTVHTNNTGSEIFSNIIADIFAKEKSNWIIDNEILKFNSIFEDIKCLDVNKYIYDHLTITGKGKILGVYQTVGPFSCYFEQNIDNKIEIKTNKDKYCYYVRDTIAHGMNCTFSKFVTFKILQNKNTDDIVLDKNIDLLRIKNQYEENLIGTKHFNIKSIFYQGDIINVDLK